MASCTKVYKYGATTGYTWGTVRRASIRVCYETRGKYYVSGLYEINMSGTNAVAGGDSGGPVWRTSGTSHLLHGIVTGGTSGGGIMYTTPIPYVEHWGFQTKTN